MDGMDTFDDLMSYQSVITQDLEQEPNNVELHYCNILICSKMNTMNGEILKREYDSALRLTNAAKEKMSIAKWLVVASAGMFIIHLIRFFI